MADARIFEDLKRDHDRHRDLLEKISTTSGDSADRRTLFEKFRVEVSAHAAAEEESLYAAMLGRPDLRDDARHSVSEHKEIDDYLGELADTDMSSGAWLRKFRDMRHRYEHHIDEEEEDMFPAAADALSQREEGRIADMFEKRKPAEAKRAADADSGDDRD